MFVSCISFELYSDYRYNLFANPTFPRGKLNEAIRNYHNMILIKL